MIIHTAKLVKETIEAFGWEILSHAAYSPDLALSDYHLLHRRTCSAALHFLRRCTKMARWLVWLKRATIFLAWHPQIVKQVEKMYSYRWAILRIKYFLSFSCNKRVFSIKNFRFIFTYLVYRDFKNFKYLNRNDNEELLKIGHHVKEQTCL